MTAVSLYTRLCGRAVSRSCLVGLLVLVRWWAGAQGRDGAGWHGQRGSAAGDREAAGMLEVALTVRDVDLEAVRSRAVQRHGELGGTTSVDRGDGQVVWTAWAATNGQDREPLRPDQIYR